MRESEGRFTWRDWSRVPEHQRRACVVLIVCVLFFIVSSVGVVLVLILDARAADVRAALDPTRGTSDSLPQGGSGGVQGVREPEPFAGGILAQGTDAAQEYLDETLFIGDSNMVRMYAYGLVPLENVMAMEGMGVESVVDLPCVYYAGESKAYTIPQAVAKTNPRRIVMTFGTNDAGGAYTTETFMEVYRGAVRAIQKACPDCDLILNSIPPVCKQRSYPDTDMDTINEFNAAILALAQEWHMPYLDSAEALTGADGYAKPEYWVEDGLHMNKDALEVLLNYVRTHPYRADEERDPAPLSDSPERRLPPGWQGYS